MLALGSIGVGAALLGGLPLYATYGSGKLIVPGAHLTVGGAGLIMASWWSDIYAAAGGDRLGGRPRTLPALAVELGTTWQHSAYLGERLLLAPAAELRRGRWAARAAGLLATDGSAVGARVDVETRAWSIAPAAAPTIAASRHTGSAIAFRAALHYHGEPDQHFALVTGELTVRGRLDLARLDPHVGGTFVELEEGLGLQLTRYDAGSADVGTILLSRFAWGLYLPGGRGELGVFYDHRRDQMAGGFRAGPAAGFFGSIGATAEVVLASPWTGFAQVEVGTDWVTTVALRRELP